MGVAGPVSGTEREALEVERELLQISQRSLALYAEYLHLLINTVMRL
jgi:hypothetical protein